MPFQTGFEHQAPEPEKQTYHIVDLFWLINLNMKDRRKVIEGETALCIISYNASYNTMKISLRNLTEPDAVRPNYINLEKTVQLGVAYFGSETACEVLEKINNGANQKITITERLFSANIDWTPGQSQVIVHNSKFVEIKSIKPDNNIFSFPVFDWQLSAFKRALEFMIIGSAWTNNINATINRLSTTG
jgi:hypothetical protein